MLNDKKTYAAITSPKHRAMMEQVLPAGSILYVEENPDLKAILAAIYRRNIDVVIIDDDGLPYKPEAEADIYAFPAAQTGSHQTQVIFIPATDRVVGDPFLSRLVSVNICDIIDPHEADLLGEINRMVNHPSTFADAVRWFNPDLLPEEAAEKKRRKSRKNESKTRFWSRGKKADAEPEEPSAFDAAERAIIIPEEQSPLESNIPAGESPMEQLRRKLAEGDLEAEIPSVEAVTRPEESKPTAHRDPSKPIPGKKIKPKEKIEAEEDSEGIEAEWEPAPPEEKEVSKPQDAPKVTKPAKNLNEAVRKAVAASNTIVSVDEEGLPMIPASMIDLLVEQVTEQVQERIGDEVMEQIEAKQKKQEKTAQLKRRTIAIASLEAGAGATHLTLATALYLSKRLKGKSGNIGCGLCDAAELNAMSALLRNGATANGKAFKAHGVTYALLGDQALEEVNWLVQDCGKYTPQHQSRALAAFSTAALKCMVVQGDPWKARANSALLESLNPAERASWTWCFRNANDSYVNKFVTKCNAGGHGNVHTFIIPPDNGKWWDGEEPDLTAMLRAILPANVKQGSKQNQKQAQKPNQKQKTNQQQQNQQNKPEASAAKTPQEESNKSEEQQEAKAQAAPEEKPQASTEPTAPSDAPKASEQPSPETSEPVSAAVKL